MSVGFFLPHGNHVSISFLILFSFFLLFASQFFLDPTWFFFVFFRYRSRVRCPVGAIFIPGPTWRKEYEVLAEKYGDRKWDNLEIDNIKSTQQIIGVYVRHWAALGRLKSYGILRDGTQFIRTHNTIPTYKIVTCKIKEILFRNLKL